MMLVVMGPDGCGKSSVIQGITRNLSAQFHTIQYQHLMPSLKQCSSAEQAQIPHGKTTYNLPLSLLKLLYLMLKYTFGSLPYQKIIQSHHALLIFDRYYHDILIDPQRFRYGGPYWLLKLVCRIIPAPHLFILLDADAETLQLRKQEVPFAETARQRTAYLSLFKRLKNAHIIDATAPLEDTIETVRQLVLAHRNPPRKQ